MSPGCGHGQTTVDLVRDVLRVLRADARLETVTIATPAEAERRAFPGSPTVRVDGTDIDPDAPRSVGLG